MKYKVGDIVKIKTWDALEKEYGLNAFGNIVVSNHIDLYPRKEKELVNIFTDRIAEISEIGSLSTPDDVKFYYLKNISKNFIWVDGMIECLASELIPIYSRFEILDIR